MTRDHHQQQPTPVASSIQLPPPRPRQKESRLARLWFQYCLLTGSWAIEPWEKVLFHSIVCLILFFSLRMIYNTVSAYL